MRQGELGHDLYILLNGNVEIAARDGGSGKVNVVSVGDVFGVAALMCGKPRVATAVAVGNAEVLALSWNRLQRLARFFPRSAYLLFKNLSIVTGERLANHVVSTNGPVPDAGCAADGNQ
jgi:CRP-like cAMP-binding protein